MLFVEWNLLIDKTYFILKFMFRTADIFADVINYLFNSQKRAIFVKIGYKLVKNMAKMVNIDEMTC